VSESKPSGRWHVERPSWLDQPRQIAGPSLALGCPARERRRGLVRKHSGPTIAGDISRKPFVTFESPLRTFEKPFRSFQVLEKSRASGGLVTPKGTERTQGAKRPEPRSGEREHERSGVRAGGLEPYRRKPRSSTISRSCSDHAGLRRRRFPVRPFRSLACPRGVAAAWQR